MQPETALSLALTDASPSVRFDSKALTHGLDAAGARWIRPGFSWNDEMDLAWAVGFPDMIIVVTGAPELDDPSTWKEFFQRAPQGSGFIGAKTLMANLYESLTEKDPLALPPEELAGVLERRDLTTEETLTLVGRWLENTIRCMSLKQVEALAGPDLLAECIVAKLEEKKGKHVYGGSMALGLLGVVLKRVRASTSEALLRRIEAIEFEDGYEAEAQEALLDPLRLGDNYPRHMSTPCAFRTQYLDGHPDITMRAVAANRAFGSTRIAYRTVFTGPEEALDAFAKKHLSIHRGTRNQDYLAFMTSIRSERLLPAFLAVADERKCAPAMRRWFEHHKDFFVPGLQKLGKKKGKLQAAANAMLAELGEKPMAPLVPREERKSLNPPDEWEKAFAELEKLDEQVLACWGDAKALKKAFKATFKKVSGFAASEGWDWPEQLFGEAWAEHEHKGLSEEQYQALSKLYDEIVVG